MAAFRGLLLQFATASAIGAGPFADTCPGLEQSTPVDDHDDSIPDLAAYDVAVAALDLEAVKADMMELLTKSQNCWPADYGNYGPFFIRLAWHCSGSYRGSDGKGGCTGGKQRFEPERSWADNTNLDKARALLAPLKQKYGIALSWGDLFILAGTTALRSMGTPIKEFCVGRIDEADGTTSLDLGPSAQQEEDAPCPINGKCEKPLGTTTIGLIYLNPEGPVAKGPDGTYAPNPDPSLSAKDVRDSFLRMNHSDRATVALIGGGHAFGKTHGACPKGAGLSPKEAYPHAAPWQGLCGTGKGADTFTSGFEGAWTTNPLRWDNEFFKALLENTWEKHIGPGGHFQWRIKGKADDKRMRLTSDVALLYDDRYLEIVKEFAEDMYAFDEAFDDAWTKLTTLGGSWSKNRKCDKMSFSKMLSTDSTVVV